MPQNTEEEQLAKLISIIQEAIQRDQQLRQTYGVGEKFIFIRDRLQALLGEIERATSATSEKKSRQLREVQVEEDEILVFIHLYNAQGLSLRTWEAMITPRAFFDFSVNRPIYKEKAHIEAFIHTKANKAQHAYLTIAMKIERVLPVHHEEGVKDVLGNVLIKIKEGSLRPEKLVSFTHNKIEYQLSDTGDLIVKAVASSAAE
jgi:intracellular multiplication protein IcmQ